MITAIPMKDQHIANHFSRADEMLFIDEQGQVKGRFVNPALAEGCEGKQQLVSMILANGADRVIVRNIGQQLLSKLLSQQLSVFHAKNGRTAIEYFAGANLADCEPFTEASQGRPSINNIAKKANGGCCNHEHEDGHHAHGEEGCHGKSDSATHKRCCESESELANETATMKRCCKKHSIMHHHHH
ncbi:NifB/NifX family molybdenum-iron cluster-binding protein [Shewanella sp. H8]|uniref:NifB/NifX family molybdenum-iron cluster-binding protein n=1 Tax=Shewanella sp. H8 TaxID=3342676 RepID=UPI003315F523